MQKDVFLRELKLTIFPNDTVQIFRKEFENRYPKKQEVVPPKVDAKPIEEAKELSVKKVTFAP